MKILFEHFKTGQTPSPVDDFITPAKIKKLLDHEVSSIFIFSSDTVDSGEYLRMVNSYRESGFRVHTMHMDSLNNLPVDHVATAVSSIAEAFSAGNCYVVSYGNSPAVTVITCFYLFTGKSIDEAMNQIAGIRARMVPGDTDRELLRAYKKIQEAGRPAIARREPLPGERNDGERQPDETRQTGRDEKKKPADRLPGPASHSGDERKQKQRVAAVEDAAPAASGAGSSSATPRKNKTSGDAKTPPSAAKPSMSEDEYLKLSEEFLFSAHTGPFYRSLKFKLISIISSIIVVSMSGMIFIATHFFKNDNTVRVQENNLKYSEIISSKVSSELDKSAVIASTMLQSSGDAQAASADFNESDVLCSALMVQKAGAAAPATEKVFYNRPVMDRYLIAREKIDDIQNRATEDIARSFRGETLLLNVSQGLEAPVILLVRPHRRTAGRPVDRVLAVYLKVDTMLKAFQTAGIVKPFMVNDRGDIIAHSDGSIVLSGGNLAKLPIVDRMMKSTIDNGQSRYSDENGVFFLASFKKIDQYGCGVVSSVDERTAYQEVYNIQRRNIYLMIIMLSTAILIVFFFGRSITTPIIRLVAATKQIIQGNYRVNIRPTTRDEIGELTFSFIEMGKGLEEREKIKSAFGKFVNKEIAEAAMRDELRLGGERKNVAIFFSDIRSFTSISENLEPEQVVEFLNDYMTRMVKCVEENHGVVDKFIGDAIMAIWGTPLSSGNDTENAINSALQMRKELVLFNRDRGGPGKPFIKIGCGINSGPVLAGQIGSEDRMEYTVIGDAVNLASRIEALNKPFGTDILISEDAFAQVRDIFAVEKMQTIKVKGKEAPQQIFAVLGRLDDPSRIKTMDELRDMLGMEPQPFSRRSSDRDTTEEGEQKYEIIGE